MKSAKFNSVSGILNTEESSAIPKCLANCNRVCLFQPIDLPISIRIEGRNENDRTRPGEADVEFLFELGKYIFELFQQSGVPGNVAKSSLDTFFCATTVMQS